MGELWRWSIEHGFDLISVGGIIAGLLFTAASVRRDTRSRRLANLINLTQQHREIWREALEKPGLERVADRKADIKLQPVSPHESRFVVFLVLHLHCWFRAMKAGEIPRPDGIVRDIEGFFDLPIPRKVWRGKRRFWDADFVRFVEDVTRRKKG